MNSIEKAIERLLKKTDDGGNKIMSEAVAQSSVTPNQSGTNKNSPERLLLFDFEKLKQLGYITPLQKNTSLSEEFRIIKRPLIRNMAGKGAAKIQHGNMIMVSSSLPGEGKTFMTLNLALSIVDEKDSTVLLIDCDVVNPTLTRMLGLSESKGLTDVLNNADIEIGDVIYNTDIENLKFIPAGQLNAYSTELLASEKMDKLVAELSQRYNDRVVLFDSPPLLVTSQAVVLSHLMGQILVVIAAGSTPKNIINDSLQLLDQNDVVGVVLNKNRSSSLGGYYYGAYHEAANKK